MSITFSHNSLTAQSRLFGVTMNLYQFVSHVQNPRLGDKSWAEAARMKCRELNNQVRTLKGSMALESVASGLQDYAKELEHNPNLQRLKELYQSLAQGYERLRVDIKRSGFERSLDKSVRLQPLKIINYPRNIFHICMGLSGVLLYEYVLSYGQALGILLVMTVICLTLERFRRISPNLNRFLMDRVFRTIARPWERHQVNSATYYTIALTLTVFLFPKHAAEIGALVLAFGDPAATIAGKKWGTRKLWREKSYAGTAAFLVAAALSVFVFMTMTGLLTPWQNASLAVSVAVVGAATEAFVCRIDDNLTIPVLCAAIASFWF